MKNVAYVVSMEHLSDVRKISEIIVIYEGSKRLPPDLISGPAFLSICLSLLILTYNTERGSLTSFREHVRNKLFMTKIR
jgi:hypothetical protein